MTVKDMNKHTEALENARNELIEAEAKGIAAHERKLHRARLEELVGDALESGMPIENISEASGITIPEIRTIEATRIALKNLDYQPGRN